MAIVAIVQFRPIAIVKLDRETTVPVHSSGYQLCQRAHAGCHVQKNEVVEHHHEEVGLLVPLGAHR
jgi:hypothetical protein